MFKAAGRLSGLMLILLAGTAAASSCPVAGHRAAVPFRVVDLTLVTPASPPPEADQDGMAAAADRFADRQSLPVWSYAVSDQLTVDLRCRLAIEDDAGTAPDGAGVDQFTQNLLLGFRYHF